MKKRYILVLLLILLFPINVLGLDIKGKYAVAYNIEEKKIVYEKEASYKTSIASLTKIATSIVSIEKIKNLEETVIIDKNLYKSLKDASLAGFKDKQVVTYKDLLYGTLLPSGADAATNLAYNVFGSLDKCVEAMNILASKLKLTNTHFSNVTGLDDDNNYSTANDIVTLLNYALTNDTFKTIYESKEYVISDKTLTLKSTIYNYYNDLNYIYGSKTGTTTKAGYSISTIGGNKESNYIVILLNSLSEDERINDIKLIYQYLFDNYSYKMVIKKDQVLTNINVKYSKEKNVDVKSNKDYKVYLSNEEYNNLKYNYNSSIDSVSYFSKDKKIGTYEVTLNDKKILDIPVEFVNNTKLDKAGILKKFIFIPIILIILLVLAIIYKKKSKNGGVMEIDVLKVGTLQANCYILTKGNDCLIIDPGAEYKKIMDKIKNYNLLGILVTHEHNDHIGCVKRIVKAKNCKLFYKANLNEKEYQVGPFDFDVLFTPGHSKESISFYFRNENIMFVGDFVFKGSIGRMDLDGGNIKEMKNSIYELLKYPDDTVIYPGHGPYTNLGEEKETNIYLRGEL